jgi:hypothetical protein
MMKTLLDAEGRYTVDAINLRRKVTALVGPILSEFRQKGYALDDITQHIHEAIDFTIRNGLYDRDMEEEDE